MSGTVETKRPAPITIYASFEHAADYLRSPFLLLIRLFWGWQFLTTGWGKLHNLPHVREFFASLGVPAPAIMAPAIATLEFVGGILLIVGLLTRLTGLLLACNMFVAYVTGDREAVASLFSSDPSKFLAADPFSFLLASLIVLCCGAGLFALDTLIFRKNQPRT
jgi:putative oxidoreductase